MKYIRLLVRYYTMTRDIAYYVHCTHKCYSENVDDDDEDVALHRIIKLQEFSQLLKTLKCDMNFN